MQPRSSNIGEKLITTYGKNKYNRDQILTTNIYTKISINIRNSNNVFVQIDRILSYIFWNIVYLLFISFLDFCVHFFNGKANFFIKKNERIPMDNTEKN